MNDKYTSLAPYYDALNADVDVKGWADFLESAVSRFGKPHDGIWLDLACGTGSLTLEMKKRGHDMIGADLSPDMLDAARSKPHGGEVLWLCQDMRELELYGTVDAVFCCLDSLNYLPSAKDLTKVFSLVNNYLNPDGVFVFDMNTPKKFREVYGDRDYLLEGENVFCGWHNEYDEAKKRCDFFLSIFAYDGENDVYRRFDEEQREYCYSMKQITSALKKAGLELLSVVSDFAGAPWSEDDERWFFLCRGTGKNE